MDAAAFGILVSKEGGMDLIWKSVAGYEGQYEVSDAGDVRSLDRKQNLAHAVAAGRCRKVAA